MLLAWIDVAVAADAAVDVDVAAVDADVGAHVYGDNSEDIAVVLLLFPAALR